MTIVTTPQLGTINEASISSHAKSDKKVSMKSNVGTPQTISGIQGSLICSNSTIRVLFVAVVMFDFEIKF